MKLTFTFISAFLLTFFAQPFKGHAQTVSSFENLSLATDTFWHSTIPSDPFTSGNVTFPSAYDTTWMYWSGGWAYSNQIDTALAPSSPAHLFVAKAGSGYQSANFGVGQNYSVARLTGTAAGGQVNGVWVTNSAFAYNSMTFGDAFAKQFGGATGNDTDWFKLTIYNYYGGVLTGNSVDFYLADYRFANNAQDYIVNDWQWVDLTPLGNTDSLLFELSSTDNNSFGMNTPGYFCIDDLTTADSPMSIVSTDETVYTLYPNPVVERITLNGAALAGAQVQIYSSTGEVVASRSCMNTTETFDFSNFASGAYVFVITSADGSIATQNVIKQ
jgi:hypothetical protein